VLIGKIGEFGLIERFRRSIRLDRSVIKGSGDDCAVLRLDKNNYQLFTCDMIVEGVDFTRRDNPYLIGRKAVAVSISDIAACAGIPRYAVVSLGLPLNSTLDFVDKLFKGALDIAKKYKISIVGGDLSRARQLMLDVSMIGTVEKKNLVLRSDAKVKDCIFVSGPLGGSIRGKHLKFNPRVDEARFLVKNFKINSMIDISDGLVQDLGHILEQSRVGARIYETLIPRSKEARNFSEALYMGEDFELLFTASQNEARKILKKSRAFFPIGEVRQKSSGLTLVDKRSRAFSLRKKGFEHF
jgi:thiamine-monophosphate kinase